jgi:hypothetical protein
MLPGASKIDDLVSVLTQLQTVLNNIAASPPDLLNQRQPLANVASPLNATIAALESIFNTTLTQQLPMSILKDKTVLPTTKGVPVTKINNDNSSFQSLLTLFRKLFFLARCNLNTLSPSNWAHDFW